MEITMEKGTQALFVELEQKDTVKRFLVPQLDGVEGRIKEVIKRNPALTLVRIGRAIVASKDETNELQDGLEGFPSKITATYNVDFCGDHPVLPMGPARFSLELISEISKAEPVQVEEETPAGQTSIYDFTVKEEVKTPALPKADLTSSFKNQIEQQKQQSLQDKLNAKLTEVKSLPVAQKSELEVVKEEDNVKLILPSAGVNDKEKFTDAMKQAEKMLSGKTTKKESTIQFAKPQPEGKLDIIIRKIQNMEALLELNQLTELGEVSAEDLSEWFWHHVDTIGHQKTFAILASRLMK